MGNAAPASVPVPVPAPVAVLPVLDLDLDALRRDVKAFATTRNDKKPFNILLIGLQGVGKSSLINTIFRAVTGQPSLIAPTSHNGAKGRHTTFAYHCYRLPECGVNLFDVGGQHYEDLFQIEVLKALLAGIRTPLLLENEHLSEISSDAQKNVVRDRLADVKNIDANNKIDCCIFVVNPVEMQAPHDRNTIIPGPYQDSQQRLFATLCNMPHSYSDPYVVFTKKDQTALPLSKLKDFWRRWVAESNAFLLQCYTDTSPKKSVHGIDEDALLLMLHILTRALRAD